MIKCPECERSRNDLFKRKGQYHKAMTAQMGYLGYIDKCFHYEDGVWASGFICNKCKCAFTVKEIQNDVKIPFEIPIPLSDCLSIN